MAVGWMIAAAVLMAVFVAVLYARLAVASRDARIRQIQAEKLIVPEVTLVPMPAEAREESAQTESWVRYAVALDDELQRYIEKLCREYEIPASVVMAVIGVETQDTYDPSIKGDYFDGYYHSFGLMQIYASEHTERCLRLNAINLLDPYQNVKVGIDYLAELLDYYDGDMTKALSFYNSDLNGKNGYAKTVLARAEQLAESVQDMED